MSNYSQVLDDIIFADFISSCIPHLNIDQLKSEAYQIRNNYESVVHSNHGGYQSPVIKKDLDFCPGLNELNQIVKNFSQDVINSKNLRVEVNDNPKWWVNINKSHDYNVVHHHVKADLIAVYYIMAPEDCGELCVVRNDGSSHTNLYLNTANPLLSIMMRIKAETGRLYLLPGHLWHYVNSNESNIERISVAFNIYLQE